MSRWAVSSNAQASSSHFVPAAVAAPGAAAARADEAAGGGGGALVFGVAYRGVYAHGDRWNAQIQFHGVKIYLGSFSTAIEAAETYDVEARKLRVR